jgi:predicted nucleic acid-binding protein
MQLMNGDSQRFLRFSLDTNLLIYAIDNLAGARHEISREIIQRAARCDCRLTLQAVSEFYSAVTRKQILPLHEAAAQAGDWLDLFPCVAASASSVRSAIADAAAGRASYWDALLLATAREAGCAVLLSEDLGDGADFSGLRVHNPFSASGGLSPLARRLLDLA